MDLQELGRALQERREAIGLTRAAVARRVDVSPSYITMVEEAQPRPGGRPSQASREVLERWVGALGWDERDAPYINQLLVLAGHVLPDPTRPPADLPFSTGALHYPQPKRLERERLINTLTMLLDRADASPTRWEITVQSLDCLFGLMQHLASASDEQWRSAAGLLRSFVEWLKFHIRGAT
jgi:transcriptional regulator with XRE-family HTH domain